MFEVTRRLEWDAAHRVMRHESKCAHLHGHRYAAEVTCAAPVLDTVDRVVDFGVVRELVGGWIDDTLDHATLVNHMDEPLVRWLEENEQKHVRIAGEPTAEVIAQLVLRNAQRLLGDSRVRVVRVRVYETPNCWADVPST